MVTIIKRKLNQSWEKPIRLSRSSIKLASMNKKKAEQIVKKA